MAKFLQRVTFIAELEIDTDGMNWEMAEEKVNYALLHGDLEEEFTANVVKVIRMEIPEED